jgi:hypothetical protein
MKSWYKIAQEPPSVEQIATQVRNSLLRDDDDSLKALCLPVSRHLAQILINNGYNAASVTQGTFTVDTPDIDAWSEMDAKDFLPAEPMETEEEEMQYAEQAMEAATYTPLHYWVQLNNMIIDITADQFNDELEDPVPEVIIGDISALGDRYTVTTENWAEPKIMYKWTV